MRTIKVKDLIRIVAWPLLIQLLLFNACFSQEGKENNAKVFGTLVDSVNLPISYATIKVLKMEDSTLVKGTIANSSGYFEVMNLRDGSYLLAFTSVASIPLISKKFRVDSLSHSIDFGKIVLEEKVLILNEVNISADHPLMDLKGGKIIVNLENSFLAPGNVVIEVLPTLPGVTNINNRLLLNGKPAMVLIDGRGEYNSKGITEIIKTLGADQVKTIEVMSSPSSRYDANIQGVIDIKLKKPSNYSTFRTNLEGQLYPTNEISGIDYNRLASGITFNRVVGKLSTSTSLDATTRSSLEKLEERINYQESINTQNTIDHTESEKYISYRSDVQYSFNSSATHVLGVTLGGFYSLLHRGTFKSLINYRSNENSQIDSSLFSVNNTKSVGSLINTITTYYTKRLFNDKHQLDIVLDIYERKFPQIQSYDNQLNPTFSGEKFETISGDKNNRINGEALNVNYTLPVSKTTQLEIGGKFAGMRNRTSIAYDFLGDNVTRGSVESFAYQYEENFACAYATLNKDFGILDMNVGVRGEDVSASGNTTAGDERLQFKYSRLYPSVSFNLSRGKKVDYQLSISRKISRRPSFNDMNDAQEYKNPLNVFRGNRNLKGQITNAIHVSSLILSKYSFSISYDIDENIRSVVPLVREDQPFTFQVINVKGGRSFIANGSIPLKLNEWWRLNSNFSIYNHRLVSEEFDLNADAWNGSINLANDFKLGDKLQIQFSASYSSPSTYGFNSSKQLFSTYLSIHKEILKKSGTLTLTINDVFGTSKWIATDEFYGVYERKMTPVTNQRVVGFRFTYRFATGSQLKTVNKRAKQFGEIRLN